MPSYLKAVLAQLSESVHRRQQVLSSDLGLHPSDPVHNVASRSTEEAMQPSKGTKRPGRPKVHGHARKRHATGDDSDGDMAPPPGDEGPMDQDVGAGGEPREEEPAPSVADTEEGEEDTEGDDLNVRCPPEVAAHRKSLSNVTLGQEYLPGVHPGVHACDTGELSPDEVVKFLMATPRQFPGHPPLDNLFPGFPQQVYFSITDEIHRSMQKRKLEDTNIRPNLRHLQHYAYEDNWGKNLGKARGDSYVYFKKNTEDALWTKKWVRPKTTLAISDAESGAELLTGQKPNHIYLIAKHQRKRTLNDEFSRIIIRFTEVPGEYQKLLEGVFVQYFLSNPEAPFHPLPVKHGNTKGLGKDTIRLATKEKQEVIEAIKMCGYKEPRAVQKYLIEKLGENSHTKNLRTITYLLKVGRESVRGEIVGHSDISTDLLSIMQRISESNKYPNVRTVVVERGKNPAIYLWSKKQLRNVARFCDKTNLNAAPLGIDKTYNMGKYFVTTICFPHLFLTGTPKIAGGARLPPTFIAAVLLHWDTTHTTIQMFLQTFHMSLLQTNEEMRGNIDFAFLDSSQESARPEEEDVERELDEEGMEFLFGADEEKAIVKAIRQSNMGGHLVLCLLHIRKNIIRFLLTRSGELQLSKAERKERIDQIFHPTTGILYTNEYADRIHLAMDEWRQQFDTEFLREQDARRLDKFVQDIIYNVVDPMSQEDKVSRHWFDNNRCESIHSVYKTMINHKPLRNITEMVDLFNSELNLRDMDEEDATLRLGRYRVIESLQYATLGHVEVALLDADGRDKHIRNWYKITIPEAEEAYQDPTNVPWSFVGTPRTKQKPGQSKRTSADRTRSRQRPGLLQFDRCVF
jgi:hypothetical protein